MRTSARSLTSAGLTLAVVTGTLATGAVSAPAVAARATATAAAPAATAAAAPITPTVRGDKPDRSARRIARIMSRMTLTDKIGQLFVMEFAGQDANNPDAASAAINQAKYGVSTPAEIVTRYHLGGVIYFGTNATHPTPNVANPTQGGELSNGLQAAALTSAPRVPLIISTDQEGGVVTRIGPPAATSPGNMTVGATFDPANASKVAGVLGSELRAMGIRLNYAPVADVNTNPFNAADGARTFGDRTKPVSKFVAAAVAGQRAYRTAVSAKHFPGLGSVSANTDFSVAISNQTRRQFETIDFPPFRAAIAAKADSIMTSHMIAPGLDASKTPASLSKPIVTGILRKQLGFNGVIITDTLDAKALAQWTSGQLAYKAFKAGNDMLMMSINLQEAMDTLKAAVRSGKITAKRLNDSVRRILALKLDRGVLDNPWAASPESIAATVGSPAHLNTMQTVTNQGTTLIARSTAGAPLHPGSKVLLVGFGASTLPAVGALMTSAGADVEQFVTGSNPQLADISNAVTKAASKDVVVVQTYNAWSSIGQQNLIAALRGTGVPLVMAIMAAPYDAALAPDARAIVAVYSYQRPCQVALVNVLFGQEPLGRLPVTVRNLTDQSIVMFPYGTGLRWN